MSREQGHARRWFAAGVAALTTAGGLVVGTAGPAAADPTTLYVGVGSAVTQDLMNQVAVHIGGGAIGSWDATNAGTGAIHDQIMPKPGCVMTRPVNSEEGIDALRHSPPGCVDFARSSIGPSATIQDPNGTLIWVPFAVEGFATTTGPATPVSGSDPAVATNIVDADRFSTNDVRMLYQCGPVVPAGSTVQYVPDGTVTDATHQPIHLYVPQAGSETRSVWAAVMGFNSTLLPACVHDTIEGGGTVVEEADGSAYATDPDAFGPFSISSWIVQRNGLGDHRHNAVLHNLNGVVPLTPGGTLNTAYPVLRELFNVVHYAQVTSMAPADRQFVGIFGGTGSAMCGSSVQILSSGFGLLSTMPLGHLCGQLDNALRGN